MLEAILGQPEGVAYLRKVTEGTLALPLLLVGEQGVGRRSSVLEAAKAVFEPTQHVALERGHHPDFHFVCVEEDKDISLLIKATKPGVYTIEKAPPEGAEQGSDEGRPAGEP